MAVKGAPADSPLRTFVIKRNNGSRNTADKDDIVDQPSNGVWMTAQWSKRLTNCQRRRGMTDQQPDNARAKKRVDMTQKPTVTHYDNGTVLLTRPDKSAWFGLAEHLQYHFVDINK